MTPPDPIVLLADLDREAMKKRYIPNHRNNRFKGCHAVAALCALRENWWSPSHSQRVGEQDLKPSDDAFRSPSDDSLRSEPCEVPEAGAFFARKEDNLGDSYRNKTPLAYTD